MEEYGKELEIYEYIKGKCLTFTSKHHRNLNNHIAITFHPSVFKGEDSFLPLPSPVLPKHRTLIVKCYNMAVFLLAESLPFQILAKKETFPEYSMACQQFGWY